MGAVEDNRKFSEQKGTTSEISSCAFCFTVKGLPSVTVLLVAFQFHFFDEV